MVELAFSYLVVEAVERASRASCSGCANNRAGQREHEGGGCLSELHQKILNHYEAGKGRVTLEGFRWLLNKLFESFGLCQMSRDAVRKLYRELMSRDHNWITVFLHSEFYNAYAGFLSKLS